MLNSASHAQDPRGNSHKRDVTHTESSVSDRRCFASHTVVLYAMGTHKLKSKAKVKTPATSKQTRLQANRKFAGLRRAAPRGRNAAKTVRPAQ